MEKQDKKDKLVILNMDDLKNNLVNILKFLIEKDVIYGIKIELAQNIIPIEALYNLNEFRKFIPLVIKIGGCEAKNDIFDAQNLDVSGICVPMIETPYSLIKFVDSVNNFFASRKNTLDLYANIETYIGFQNLEKILSLKQADDIKGIILGRDDMVGSLGLDENSVNSEKVFDIAVKMSKIAEKYNKEFSLGGKIRPEAVPFLKKMGKYHLDKIETRMIIFNSKKLLSYNNIETFILKAVEFEIVWLKYIRVIKGFKYINI